MWERVLEFLEKEALCEAEIAKMNDALTDAEIIHLGHHIVAKKEVCSWLKTTIEQMMTESPIKKS